MTNDQRPSTIDHPTAAGGVNQPNLFAVNMCEVAYFAGRFINAKRKMCRCVGWPERRPERQAADSCWLAKCCRRARILNLCEVTFCLSIFAYILHNSHRLPPVENIIIITIIAVGPAPHLFL